MERRRKTSAHKWLNFREIFACHRGIICASSCYVMCARARSASSTCKKSRAVDRANNTNDDAPSRAYCPPRRVVVGGGFICLLVESGRETRKREGEGRERETRGLRPPVRVASLPATDRLPPSSSPSSPSPSEPSEDRSTFLSFLANFAHNFGHLSIIDKFRNLGNNKPYSSSRFLAILDGFVMERV